MHSRDPLYAPRRKTHDSIEGMVGEVKSVLRGRAEVLSPKEAKEPILAQPVRDAIAGWLAEIRAAEELRAVGMKPRSTALLEGPPGCGKTTLAHHLAARLGIPMVLLGGEALLSSPLLGAAENATAKLFDDLMTLGTRCLIFMDEIDSIGMKRGEERGGGATTGRNNVLNVLLRKIESFEGILIGATNRADSLDPALWRRFGMQIEVSIPDDEARWAILKRYSLPFDLADEDIDLLCQLTAGAAPSLLRQLMEGMKRALVLGERIGMPTEKAGPVATFAAILAANKPHPDYQPPPLWADANAVKALAGIAWPPQRGDA